MTDGRHPHWHHLPPDPPGRPLLEARDLVTWLATPRGPARAVDGVSLSVERGRTLGVVGESGSGKTMLARSVMGLFPHVPIARIDGTVLLGGEELPRRYEESMREWWGTEIAMVFQNPLSSLNPVVNVGRQITEILRVRLDFDRRSAREQAVALLASVGIPDPGHRFGSYPHELSGGMRQRVGIAIALACGPRLLIADEPTTALDVTVQRQILDLLAEAQDERFMGMILITHDLGVVAGRTDEVAVMYAGRIVERGPTRALFHEPRHPYTEALLGAIPQLEAPSHQRLAVVGGRPPDLVDPPPGCRFAPRCRYAQDRCLEQEPALGEAGTLTHPAACFYPVGSEAGRAALERNRKAGGSVTGVAVTPVRLGAGS